MNTQSKVLAEIKKIAGAVGLDADVESSFSNVGRIYFRQGLDTIGNISFDFQSSRATFAIAKDSDAHYFGHNEGIFLIEYSSPKAFAPLFGAIQVLLKKRGT